MPVPLIQGLTDYLTTALGLTAWDGEVPRQDTTGVDIDPDTVNAASWPVVRVVMPPGGLDRSNQARGGLTFLDAYGDSGVFTVQVWATTRAQLEDTAADYGWVSKIEQALVNEGNWPDITFNSPSNVPYRVYLLNLVHWTVVDEEEQRLRQSQLLYRGDVAFEIGVHGAVATR